MLPSVVGVGVAAAEQLFVEQFTVVGVHEGQKSSELASGTFSLEFQSHRLPGNHFFGKSGSLRSKVCYWFAGGFGLRRIHPPKSYRRVGLGSVGDIQNNSIAVDDPVNSKLLLIVFLEIPAGLTFLLPARQDQNHQQTQKQRESYGPTQSGYYPLRLLHRSSFGQGAELKVNLWLLFFQRKSLMYNLHGLRPLVAANQTGNSDFTGGDSIDIYFGLGQGPEHGVSNTRMATHAHADG